jgi:hypothetical protein
MKNLILAIAITLSLTAGFNITYSNETSASQVVSTGLKYVKVSQDGAIWVYVYTEDGTFVAKWIEVVQ